MTDLKKAKKECTTHHDTCDCREAKLKQLKINLDFLLRFVNEMSINLCPEFIGTWQERVFACIKVVCNKKGGIMNNLKKFGDYPTNPPPKSNAALEQEEILDKITEIAEDLEGKINIDCGDGMIDIDGRINIDALEYHIARIKELKERWDKI